MSDKKDKELGLETVVVSNSEQPTKGYSDFWRKKFSGQDDEELSSLNEEFRAAWLLKKTLHDSARVANMFDSDLKLAFWSKESDPKSDVIYLDPSIALDENKKLSEKIDLYVGEILINAAKNKSGSKEQIAASKVEMFANDNHKSAIASLHLALENFAASEAVKEQTPGLSPYVSVRTDHIIGRTKDLELEKYINEPEELGKMAKVSALIREIDSLATSDLEKYGEFKEEIAELAEKAKKTKSSHGLKELAKKYVEKYLGPTPLFSKKNMKAGGFGKNLLGDESKMKVNHPGVPEEMSGVKELSDILKDKIFDGMVQDAKTVVEEPTVSGYDYSEELNQVNAIVEQTKDALQFLNTEILSWEEYGLRRGDLDEGGLSKLAENSDRLFYVKDSHIKPSIQIGLLIDQSGSMAHYNSEGSRIDNARKLAIGLANGIKEILGIDLFVYGHSGDDKCVLFHYLSPDRKEEEDFKSLSKIRAWSSNFDGYAIKSLGEMMLEDSRREYSRRLMFSISDGQPHAGYNYYGEEAHKHVRSVCNWLLESGLEVYGIGIDNAYDEQTNRDLYGEGRGIVLPDFNPGKVAGIISGFLAEVAKANM